MRKKTRGDRLSGVSRLASLIRQRRTARRERWARRFHTLRSVRRGVASFLLLIYLVGLGYLTLGRFYQLNPGYNLVPGRTIFHDLGKGGTEFLINTIGNLVATMPLGVLLPLVVPRWVGSALRAALASFVVSVLIEVTQGWMGSRVADVDDLILNTLGGWFGYGLTVAYRRWFRRRSESGIRAVSPGGASRTRPPVLP